MGVCDSPEYFYNHVQEMATALQIDTTSGSPLGPVREWLSLYAGEGTGYAKSTAEELAFIINASRSTGIVLDPVYSGKGLYHFATSVVPRHPEVFRRGQTMLFIHTGGTVGMYDKEAELLPLLGADGISRMKVRPKA